jgi:cardiolipin synthase
MIMSAKKNVYIETPYFTPTEEFYNALKIAAYTGVNVHIIIPGTWDKFYMKAASFEFAREMCADGIHFYLYPGFIHSKMITIDKKITSIGSTNIDNRSFSLHYEENVIFYDEKFTGRCESIFERDRKISMPVTKEYFDQKSILKRAFWSLCKLFSPFM